MLIFTGPDTSDEYETRFAVDGSIFVPRHSIHRHDQCDDAVDSLATFLAILLDWMDIAFGSCLAFIESAIQHSTEFAPGRIFCDRIRRASSLVGEIMG